MMPGLHFYYIFCMGIVARIAERKAGTKKKISSGFFFTYLTLFIITLFEFLDIPPSFLYSSYPPENQMHYLRARARSLSLSVCARV